MTFLGCPPFPVTVTTKIVTFLVGDPELNLHLPQEYWEGGQPKWFFVPKCFSSNMFHFPSVEIPSRHRCTKGGHRCRDLRVGPTLLQVRGKLEKGQGKVQLLATWPKFNWASERFRAIWSDLCDLFPYYIIGELFWAPESSKSQGSQLGGWCWWWWANDSNIFCPTKWRASE